MQPHTGHTGRGSVYKWSCIAGPNVQVFDGIQCCAICTAQVLLSILYLVCYSHTAALYGSSVVLCHSASVMVGCRKSVWCFQNMFQDAPRRENRQNKKHFERIFQGQGESSPLRRGK